MSGCLFIHFLLKLKVAVEHTILDTLKAKTYQGRVCDIMQPITHNHILHKANY